MSMIDLGNRMKNYEVASRLSLPPRMPLVIRVDGKAFHTYTRHFQKPFDDDITSTMVTVMHVLCEKVPGVRLAYTFSDEISLLVQSYANHNSEQWYDNDLQKIVSITAAYASSWFTTTIQKTHPDASPAIFDSRAHVIPEDDVVNYFIWRQREATRNSISTYARHVFSHKGVENKSCVMLLHDLVEAGKPWKNLPGRYRYGIAMKKRARSVPPTVRHVFTPDIDSTPNFLDDRTYVKEALLSSVSEPPHDEMLPTTDTRNNHDNVSD